MNKILKLAFMNNYRRKSRTLLALLGIIIGIGALITLVSVVDGMYKDMSDTVSNMQGLMVYGVDTPSPVFGTINNVYETKLKTIPGVDKVIPELIKTVGEIDSERLEFKGPGNTPILIGVKPSDFEDSTYGSVSEKIRGNELRDADKGFVLISNQLADDYKKSIGSRIEIDGKSFTVKGIFESASKNTDDGIIALPEDVRELYDISNDKSSYFTVVPLNPSNADRIKDLIEFKYDDLQAMSQQELLSEIGGILDNLRLLVVVVAIISAIVAGVGVINTMLMSVMERVKEIGTLKAVGWTKENIVILIILESAFIGIIGGLLGIILGYLGSFILVTVIDIPSYVSMALVIESFLFALFIGVFGGLYPAWIASKQDPIEALRDD